MLSRIICAPSPPFAAISLLAPASPAAPRSRHAATSPLSITSSVASITSFSVNGSPICTLPRSSASDSSLKSLDAKEAPPSPSLPVDEPMSINLLPACCAVAVTILSSLASPTHTTLTSGFPLKLLWKYASPLTTGTPIQLPYPAIPIITCSKRYLFFSLSSGPKYNGSIRAIGRAPIEMISRTIPPIPVAAPL